MEKRINDVIDALITLLGDDGDTRALAIWDRHFNEATEALYEEDWGHSMAEGVAERMLELDRSVREVDIVVKALADGSARLELEFPGATALQRLGGLFWILGMNEPGRSLSYLPINREAH